MLLTSLFWLPGDCTRAEPTLWKQKVQISSDTLMGLRWKATISCLCSRIFATSTRCLSVSHQSLNAFIASLCCILLCHFRAFFIWELLPVFWSTAQWCPAGFPALSNMICFWGFKKKKKKVKLKFSDFIWPVQPGRPRLPLRYSDAAAAAWTEARAIIDPVV